jgi:hypothetical protein
MNWATPLPPPKLTWFYREAHVPSRPSMCDLPYAKRHWNRFCYKYCYVQSVQRLATGWTVRGSNPGGGEIFRTRPDRPWGLPSLLYNGYRVSFPEVKRPGRGVDHPPTSSAEVKERVELYLYSLSGPSWPFLGRTTEQWCFGYRAAMDRSVSTITVLQDRPLLSPECEAWNYGYRRYYT